MNFSMLVPYMTSRKPQLSNFSLQDLDVGANRVEQVQGAELKKIRVYGLSSGFHTGFFVSGGNIFLMY